MRSFDIAGIPVPNRYVLGPMAGITDYSFRKVCSDCGAGLVYSEMESCDAIVYRSEATKEDALATHLDKKSEGETKLAFQIFGGKPEFVLKSIPIFESLAEFDFLDFNCGCPVPKVLKQGSGSRWLQRQDELIDLLGKMVEVSHHPVIVKVRTGFDSEIDLPALARRMEDVGVQAIAIHGRTRNQFFSGPVNYSLIRKVKESVSIPVLANGGIDDQNAASVLEQTGADAVMIATKALGYPKVFENLIRKEEGKDPLPDSLLRQIDDLEKHIELVFSYKDSKKASDILRGISTHYIRGFENSATIRASLVHCTRKEDYLSLLEGLKRNLTAF